MYDMEWEVRPAVETPAGEVQVKSIEIEVTTNERFSDRSFNATYYKAITY